MSYKSASQNEQNSRSQTEALSEEPRGFALIVRRVLVHIFGLGFGNALSQFAQGEPMVMAQTWIGCICLIPRGNPKKPEWYIPVISGLLQTCIAFLLGFPLAESVLFGGGQTWAQRVWQRELRCSWDWVVLPALIGCLSDAHFEVAPLSLAISFILLFAASFVAHSVYRRVRAEQIHAEDLKESLTKLGTLLPTIQHEQLVSQTKLLKMHGETLSKVLKTNNIRAAFPVIERLKQTVEHISSFLEASKPSKSSGWSKGLLRSENWGRKGESALNDLTKEVQESNAFLQESLRSFRKNQKVDSDDLEKKWLAFEDSAAELLSKASTLPEALSKPVQSIAQTTLEIVKSMRDDPADRTPGERFLDRYLTAVHKIVEEHIRLSAGPVQKDVELALQRSVEVLERMDGAFKDELASLMQNDAINFSAEVDAIDAMLKMKGR